MSHKLYCNKFMTLLLLKLHSEIAFYIHPFLRFFFILFWLAEEKMNSFLFLFALNTCAVHVDTRSYLFNLKETFCCFCYRKRLLKLTTPASWNYDGCTGRMPGESFKKIYIIIYSFALRSVLCSVILLLMNDRNTIVRARSHFAAIKCG